MQKRLGQEIQEREAEAALYSSRLYESEKQQSEWFVEKRMLEQNIQKLTEEVGERDRLDQEIESCAADMFARLKYLEETNASLTAQLEAAGLPVTGQQQQQQRQQQQGGKGRVSPRPQP
jgi:hypothetical protein